MQKFYDVIIAGAGPAGLLLANELAGKCSILVLEKNSVGESNKSWLTYKDRWKRFPKKLITDEFKDFCFRFVCKDKIDDINLKDEYVCVDEHGFLRYLAENARKKGANIVEKTPFKRLSRDKEGIILNKQFKAHLLIDCCGVDSPVVQKYGLIQMPIYINLYGYTARFKNIENKSNYFAYSNKKGSSFLGINKISPGKGLVQYFTYSDKKQNLKKYKKRLKDSLERFSVPKHEVIEWKIAHYPTGVLKKRSLDNIFLFGDAGFYSPCFSGMGFNEILRQYKAVSKHLSICIKENRFSEQDLKLPDNIAQDVDNLCFRLLGLFFIQATPETISKIADIAKSSPDSQKKRILRNELTTKEVIILLKKIVKEHDLEPLIKTLQKKHILHVIKTFLELDKDIITEELHNLIFKHHKIRIKDLY